MLLYQVFITVYQFIFQIFALFNAKAKAGIEGRIGIFDRLQAKNPADKKVIWFHCASLGEFEQGRPLIEQIKAAHPELFVLLTFYSSSGYTIQQHYVFADHVDYLPFDSKAGARRFLQVVNPFVAIFVKYEFWWNFLQTLHAKRVPVVLISGIFRRDQYFFKWYGKVFLRILQKFTFLFVQDEASAAILRSHDCENCTVAGDTRIDRVLSIAKESKNNAVIEKFKGTNKLLIAGSTWHKDEIMLMKLLQCLPDDWKLVVAPHEIAEIRIDRLLQEQAVSYCNFTEYQHQDCKVLILNTIGHLSASYKYADLVYIGGGFDDGIHNILEPMAFGKSVIFGPNYRKFQEALITLASGANFTIRNEQQLVEKFLHYTQSDAVRADCSSKIQAFMNANAGATKLIGHQLSTLLGKTRSS